MWGKDELSSHFQEKDPLLFKVANVTIMKHYKDPSAAPIPISDPPQPRTKKPKVLVPSGKAFVTFKTQKAAQSAVKGAEGVKTALVNESGEEKVYELDIKESFHSRKFIGPGEMQKCLVQAKCSCHAGLQAMIDDTVGKVIREEIG